MSEGFSIRAASEKGALVPGISEDEVKRRMELGKIRDEAREEGRKVRLGESKMEHTLVEGTAPNIIDLEGKHEDWVDRGHGEPSAEALFVGPMEKGTEQVASAQPEAKAMSPEEVEIARKAREEQAAAVDAERRKVAAEHAEIQAGLAREWAELAAVQQRLKKQAEKAAAEKIQKAKEMAEKVVLSFEEQQAQSPSGTKPEDTTVN
ncbi:hypothetical protein HY415_00455 [Candidatus Kaiserbacteria bacterium]|nr:hypothetical protein [Candidatus Kaiserbacteria bacterium]